jgi:hypothetical protein
MLATHTMTNGRASSVNQACIGGAETRLGSSERSGPTLGSTAVRPRRPGTSASSSSTIAGATPVTRSARGYRSRMAAARARLGRRNVRPCVCSTTTIAVGTRASDRARTAVRPGPSPWANRTFGRACRNHRTSAGTARDVLCRASRPRSMIGSSGGKRARPAAVLDVQTTASPTPRLAIWDPTVPTSRDTARSSSTWTNMAISVAAGAFEDDDRCFGPCARRATTAGRMTSNARSAKRDSRRAR